jgi:hypothetical protein
MKTKSIIYPVALLVIAIITMSACKKYESETHLSNPIVDNSIPVGNYPSGLGNSPGTPVCKPFVLPSNIVLIGEIHGATFKSTNFNKETSNINDYIILPKTNFIDIGTGIYIHAYLKLFNKSSQPTSLIIPGGLMFCPEDSTSQTGTTTQPDTVLIPGNDSIGCHIMAYCTNLNRHAPPSNTKFKILGTTLHTDLWTVVNIMKNKKKITDVGKMQSIIWDITDRGGLTEQDKAYLNSLP